MEIKREVLSEYQLKIADLYNIPIGNVKKLVPNFFDKGEYLVHYENLQLYLRLGLKLNTVYHLLKFSQSQWLKLYIELNTHKSRSREKWRQRWKSIVQINEQCCIQQNDGKLEK